MRQPDLPERVHGITQSRLKQMSMTQVSMSSPGTQVTEADEIEGAGTLDSLKEIVTDYVHSGDLLTQLTLRDLRLRYKQSIMGFLWAILMPLLIVLAGVMVRFAVASVAGQPVDKTTLANLVIKAIPWSFFVGSIQFSTLSLVSNMNLVTKLYFPREVLPMAATMAQAVDAAVAGLAAFPILILLLDVHPAVTWLWAPVLVAMLLLVTWTFALVLSCANLFFRDVKYLVQVGLTFGVFFTPVFMEPVAFGPAAPFVMLNPLSPILEGLRLSMVQGHNLLTPLCTSTTAICTWNPAWLLYSTAWGVIGFVVASLLFHRAEFLFAEHV